MTCTCFAQRRILRRRCSCRNCSASVCDANTACRRRCCCRLVKRRRSASPWHRNLLVERLPLRFSLARESGDLAIGAAAAKWTKSSASTRRTAGRSARKRVDDDRFVADVAVGRRPGGPVGARWPPARTPPSSDSNAGADSLSASSGPGTGRARTSRATAPRTASGPPRDLDASTLLMSRRLLVADLVDSAG